MPHAEDTLGQSIPADTPHAVSVSLPTWKSNVGYEEGQDWVVSRMTTGYPRFFVNKKISCFAELIAQKYGLSSDQAMLFPSSSAASRCLAFLKTHCDEELVSKSRTVDFIAAPGEVQDTLVSLLAFSAVIYPPPCSSAAKTFWQHTGEGVSSRRAEYCHQMYEKGFVVEKRSNEEAVRQRKGPRRYRKTSSDPAVPSAEAAADNTNGEAASESQERARFVEERWGRNLNLELASDAKQAIRRRIAGSLTKDTTLEEALKTEPDATRARDVPGFSTDDVWLYPCGMNAIFSTHLRILAARGEQRKSICFGFPYIDTLKVLEKWGAGCLFYGNGTPEDLNDLEQRLERGERFLSLFCEFPSNPLLRSPDMQRIRALADKYDFVVVVDETIGNFLNVHVLPYADVLVSSLTKIFSGDGNVMGGSAVYNPKSRYYATLRDIIPYEDCYWPEDVIVMERNSRDFVCRIDRINVNAETICEVLQAHPKVKEVFYPKISPSREYYDHCRTPNGGYGGLLSATFHSTEDASLFYDHLNTEKGPSLGTNFTLASPFVLLAHYNELEWAAQFGVDKNLVRFSVGLEEVSDLKKKIQRALDAMG